MHRGCIHLLILIDGIRSVVLSDYGLVPLVEEVVDALAVSNRFRLVLALLEVKVLDHAVVLGHLLYAWRKGSLRVEEIGLVALVLRRELATCVRLQKGGIAALIGVSQIVLSEVRVIVKASLGLVELILSFHVVELVNLLQVRDGVFGQRVRAQVLELGQVLTFDVQGLLLVLLLGDEVLQDLELVEGALALWLIDC